MKIKDYKLFLENKQSNEEIDSICKKYRIENYTINSDGTVDVDGDVNLFNLITNSDDRLNGRIPLKFGKVTGYFDCSNNHLTSLEGSPYWVGRYFDCSNNQLKTLEGGPKTVLGSYYCHNNKLINFKGCPEDYEDYCSFEGNIVFKLLKKIPDDKWNKFIYWCNEYDAIDDQGKVIPERMEEVYNKLGLEYEED